MGATAKTIVLKGNPSNPESAEHHIIFPGGSISVCRTSDNKYWAHVKVNHHNEAVEGSVFASRKGFIEGIRIDTPNGVEDVDHKNTDHFAVLIGLVEEAQPADVSKEQLPLFENH